MLTYRMQCYISLLEPYLVFILDVVSLADCVVKCTAINAVDTERGQSPGFHFGSEEKVVFLSVCAIFCFELWQF